MSVNILNTSRTFWRDFRHGWIFMKVF